MALGMACTVVAALIGVFGGAGLAHGYAQIAGPSLAMHNAADKGLLFPAQGLGTAGGGNASRDFGEAGGCWASCQDAECKTPNPAGYQGCSQYQRAATTAWIQLGGRRVDDANSYHQQLDVAFALRRSGVPRKELFYLQKLGSYLPMGYQDTMTQFATMLRVTGMEYVDCIMHHWPSCTAGGGCGPTVDPACSWLNATVPAATYNETECRLNSYRATVDIWKRGDSRSVGVSNFNIEHLQEIEAAGLPLPSVNQISFNLYHSKAEMPLVQYCQQRQIIVNPWTPLARADSWHCGPEGDSCPPLPAPTPVTDPVATAIGLKYNMTAAQVQLRWQWQLGLAGQVRSQNVGHMIDNLMAVALDVTITGADMAALSNRPQYACAPPQCTSPSKKQP